MKKLLLLLILMTLSLQQVSARSLSTEAGWEFGLSLNTGYVTSHSNFSVSDNNEVIDSLEGTVQGKDKYIVFPFARVQYTSEDLNSQFFIGNSRDQIAISQFQYELGVIHQFSNGSQLTAAYFPELPFFNETWEDPFLIGSERVETEENAQGARIELTRVAGSPLTLKYAYAHTNIKNEASGVSWSSDLTSTQIASLQRDSDYHRIAIETMFPVAQQVFLKPALRYTMRNADGDANSYHDYNFQLGLLIFKGRHTSITTVNIGKSAYQDENPLFSKKQDTLNSGFFSIYSYAQPFDWDATTFTFIAGYNEEDSKINFYDKKGLICTIGIAYTFK